MTKYRGPLMTAGLLILCISTVNSTFSMMLNGLMNAANSGSGASAKSYDSYGQPYTEKPTLGKMIGAKIDGVQAMKGAIMMPVMNMVASMIQKMLPAPAPPAPPAPPPSDYYYTPDYQTPSYGGRSSSGGSSGASYPPTYIPSNYGSSGSYSSNREISYAPPVAASAAPSSSQAKSAPPGGKSYNEMLQLASTATGDYSKLLSTKSIQDAASLLASGSQHTKRHGLTLYTIPLEAYGSAPQYDGTYYSYYGAGGASGQYPARSGSTYKEYQAESTSNALSDEYYP